MHDHTPGPELVDVLFVIANLLIALGYFVTPFMVLRYLPLTRIVLVFGVLFFGLCATTHIGMALLVHDADSWFWTVEHLLQAVGTWGFVISFTAMLRKAAAHRELADDDAEQTAEVNRPAEGGEDL